MQSINQGFHQLRLLMPHLQGEKLSKVCMPLILLPGFSANSTGLLASCYGVNIWVECHLTVLTLTM